MEYELYGYNVLGDIIRKVQSGNFSTSYSYSADHRLMSSTMPSGRTETYSYSPNDNLTAIATDNKTFSYEYYDTGFVKAINYPNGLKTTYEYDNINRVRSVVTTLGEMVINTFSYTYDENSNVLTESHNGSTTSYTYDCLDRLVSVTYSDNSSVAYEYDSFNNRTKETYSDGNIREFVYNNQYQLAEIKLNGAVTDSYVYNESGALVTHNNKTYSYDAFDRMTEYSDGTNTHTYRYNTDGIRTAKDDKQYVVDVNNNVIAEADEENAITEETVWGHQPLARKVNGSWYYYIYNAHGDVVGLVNEAGTVVNTYEYTPWGEIRSETETVDNPIKYAGEYYDDELDMYYLRARYYNPQIGRFISRDILEGDISSPLDMNRYVYCRNNPIKYVDPSGEGVILACIIIGAVVGAVAGGFAGAVVSKKTTGSVSGTSVAIGVLGGATIGGLLGWGFYGLGASISATGLVSAAPGLYKTIDQGVNFAAKALQHMNEKARQVPVQVLIEAIKHGTATPDPRGGSGTKYYIEMVKNGTTYTLEVLYDKATNMIQHFMYYHK